MDLEFVGCDSWDRPVYRCGEQLWVDVDPISPYHSLHTKSSNEFDGEPDTPIDRNIEITFKPSRQTWH